MIYFTYGMVCIFILIIIFEFLIYKKIKKEIFNCIKRTLSKQKKKQLSSDIEFLYREVSALSPEMLRKIKFRVSLQNEDTFISKMVGNQFVTIATIISLMAMVSTLVVTVEPTSVLPYLVGMMNYSIYISIVLVMLSLTFLIHLKLEEGKRKFVQRFIIVIDEIEKEQPITVRLSEDQFRDLLSSSGLQRTVYRFGRHGSQEPNE